MFTGRSRPEGEAFHAVEVSRPSKRSASRSKALGLHSRPLNTQAEKSSLTRLPGFRRLFLEVRTWRAVQAQGSAVARAEPKEGLASAGCNGSFGQRSSPAALDPRAARDVPVVGPRRPKGELRRRGCDRCVWRRPFGFFFDRSHGKHLRHKPRDVSRCSNNGCFMGCMQ